MAEYGTQMFLGDTEVTTLQNGNFVFANPYSEAPYVARTDTYGSFVKIAIPGTLYAGGIFGQDDYSADISSYIRGTGDNYELFPTGSGTAYFWPSGSVVNTGAPLNYSFNGNGYTTSMFAEDGGSIGAIYGGDFSNFTGVDFAVEMWVYMNERLYQGGAPYHKSILRNTDTTFSVDISEVSNGSSQYRLRFIRGGNQYFSSNITSNLNQWYHVAFGFVASSGAMYGYWDGTRVMSATTAGTISSNLWYRLLGGDLGVNDGAKGSVQDYRITLGSNRGYNGGTTIVPADSIVVANQ